MMKDIFIYFIFPPPCPNFPIRIPVILMIKNFGLMGICCEGDFLECVKNFISTAKYAN